MSGWLAARVVALRMWLFARINGEEGIPIPGPLVDVTRFRQVYSHPAANGRSRGAALSDLFWYWLAPGPEVHQEHLEPGERYDDVAATTRHILSIPNAAVEQLAQRYTAEMGAAIGGQRLVRLRDVMMPIWAGFFSEIVFGKPCPFATRQLIVDNAYDVVSALKCLRLRHMGRRDRLTRFLVEHLDDVPHPLPAGLSATERALYLQGTFFNTAVVQMSEAMAHLLMVIAQHPALQDELAAHPDDRRRLDHVIDETMRLYPLFGIAHRITSDDIVVDERTTLPAGSVLCFNYQAFHQTGFDEPERFDPDRWEGMSPKDVNFIPFGVAANRPCPAWHLAPIAMRAATGEILRRFALYTSAGHTRSIPNRGPCLLVPREAAPPRQLGPALARMRLRDQAEDVGRSVKQLVFGTYMVWDARRKRLCERHFAEELFPQPLLDSLRRHPERTAFEHGSRTVSYGELLSMVARCADGMRSAGFGPGWGVALFTAVTPEAFAAHVAAHALGCRVAAIKPGWSTSQLASVLGDGIDAVVGDATTLTPDVRALSSRLDVFTVGDLVDGHDGGPIDVAARPHDLARVNFTSGSTGRPKGCAYTYRTLSLGYQPDRRSPDLARLVAGFERMLVYGSWSMPVMFTFAGRCLIGGGTAVIADEDNVRDALRFAIGRHRITGVAMTPPSLHTMLASLRDEPGALDSLRALVVTGSAASVDLLAAAVDDLGPVVWQGYGQAESGMISLLTPEEIAEAADAALASVGKPLPDVEISVRGDDGREVVRGEVGELYVRSPYGMAAYWEDPEETQAVLTNGWLRTRDLGCLDADGRVRLTGRSRDVIIVKGEVCYAGAIEHALARHPLVDQAYVVGVPDARTGEAIHAFIVPVSSSAAPDLDGLAELVRSELTPHHVPETVTVLREVPLAAGGKPDKQALTEMAKGADPSRVR